MYPSTCRNPRKRNNNPTLRATTARSGLDTWDSIIVSKLPFNVVPLEDGAGAGSRLGQSQVEVAGVEEGLG